ncbi:MAG: hypothetical protein O7D30_08065 [Rickettsia endosymbiont of Ixodes persulcatus]|nr:hypothetical protein [Rickettsia endosymbiont of Ixodes persulcatus]
MADTDRETGSSEGLVTSLFSKKVGIKAVSSGIERTHRLGTFNPQKSRSVIVKFSSFKEKQGILDSAHKLRGTHALQSKKIFSFLSILHAVVFLILLNQKMPFRLRHDELPTFGKRFLVDDVLESVAERCT